MKLSTNIKTGALIAFAVVLLCCSSQAMAADPCASLAGKSLNVNFNGHHGVLGAAGINLVTQNNTLTFQTTVQLTNESPSPVTGKCKDRRLQLTRGTGTSVQNYDGWIFEAEPSKVAGTFSHADLVKYGWFATMVQPPPSFSFPPCESLNGESCPKAQQKTCTKSSGATGKCYCTKHVDPIVGESWDWVCN